MSDGTRARARAQHFGPEMLDVIGSVVTRIDAEIRTCKAMNSAEVTALLLALREPLVAVRARATAVDGEPGEAPGGGA